MPDKEPKNLLILGGTSEARELARKVSLTIGKKVRVTTSLAGRRASTPALGGDVRIGPRQYRRRRRRHAPAAGHEAPLEIAAGL